MPVPPRRDLRRLLEHGEAHRWHLAVEVVLHPDAGHRSRQGWFGAVEELDTLLREHPFLELVQVAYDLLEIVVPQDFGFSQGPVSSDGQRAADPSPAEPRATVDQCAHLLRIDAPVRYPVLLFHQ